jgi:hypothetical protein
MEDSQVDGLTHSSNNVTESFHLQTGLFQRRDEREGGAGLDIERGSSYTHHINRVPPPDLEHPSYE